MFLKCQKILKDYKSKQNPLKMLKGLKSAFWVKLKALNLQLCRKVNSTTNILQLIYLPFKSNCLSRKTSKKRVWILKRNLHYVNARCIALDFQLLQIVRSTDQWSTFYEKRMNHLNGQHLLSSAINKKERETWKVPCGSPQWKV